MGITAMSDFSPGNVRPNRSRTSTIQRARICAFETEAEWVLASSAHAPTVIAHIQGDSPIVIAEDIPVFWLEQSELDRVTGGSSLRFVVHKLGFDMVSIPFEEWTCERLLEKFRETFPGIELQASDAAPPTKPSL